MSTATARLGANNRNWVWIGLGGLVLFLISAVVVLTPTYNLSIKQAKVPSAALKSYTMALSSEAAAPNSRADSLTSQDRKLVRTTSLELTVGSPAKFAEDIRKLAESLGGYLESMQVDSSAASPSACVTIRVPATRFEDAKTKLRALALHVENEKTDAKDVTKEYVDTEARIRNLRAEEAQYLQIMKSAGKVEDMLDVSEKLSEVRGQIEQQQAEFESLSKQVETVAITVSAHAQPGPEAFGIHWQPLNQIREAARDALDGLTQYASSMIAVILYLPVILLWLSTLTLALLGGWRLLRWIARRFFETPQTVEAVKPA